MYPIQNNQPLFLINNDVTDPSVTKLINNIKDDLNNGLQILEHEPCFEQSIRSIQKKNIISLLAALDNNQIVTSNISIKEHFCNTGRTIDLLNTHGYTISYNGKDVMKIIFSEKKCNNSNGHSYSITPGFSIECYDEFYCLFSNEERTSFKPTLSKDPDLVLERTDLLRKTKQQYTKDFDEEFPKRLVNKSYSNTSCLIPAKITEKPRGITKAPTAERRPIAIKIVPLTRSNRSTIATARHSVNPMPRPFMDRSIIKESLIPNTNISW